MNAGSPRFADFARQATARFVPVRLPFGRATLLAMAATLAMVVALATFQGAPSLQAQAATLISNTGQTTGSDVVTLVTGSTTDISRAAQWFDTGSNTDGYTVSTVGIKLATLSDAANAETDLKLELYSDVSSNPNAAICTLSPPATFTADSVNTFIGSHCPRLSPDTTYHVVLERVATTTANSTVSVATTAANGEDTGGATGWDIGDNAKKYSNSVWTGITTNSLQIEITGEAVTKAAATGQPVIYPSAAGGGILLADLSGIADANGLLDDSSFYDFTYQWMRVDSGDSTVTNVGDGRAWYQTVADDVGHSIKVQVSFTDGDKFPETVTSAEFGPIAAAVGPPVPQAEPTTTLVSNAGQTAATTVAITEQYAQGFRLGTHGQGYEISSVSLDLAAAPSSLIVSLWAGAHPEYQYGGDAAHKLFDFENPATLAVGANKFKAPAGAFAYQNVNYFIVLSGFGSSLSVKETTTDAEDDGGETGALIFDVASVRALTETGRWGSADDRETGVSPNEETPVLLLTVEGSKRLRGILASNYAQTQDQQEVVSFGDEGGMPLNLGTAHRYLMRGFSWISDSTTARNGGIFNPFDLRSGWTVDNTGDIDDAGTRLFSLINTRNPAGINLWEAPQGATVAGDAGYLVYEKLDSRPDGVTLSRFLGTSSDADDVPTAPGVSLADAVGTLGGRPLMAVHGEPLYAMVQNLGQADNGHVSVGGTNKVATQAFTTGSQPGGYGLLGIGVNIEGSGGNVPDDATSVTVSVHVNAGSDIPGDKLFDLISPAEYSAGHTFFEAPAGTGLAPNATYVLVWSHVGGTSHRLQKTSSNADDSGADAGAQIMGISFRLGADVGNLSLDANGHTLEIAVYTDTPPRNATGRPVVYPSAEGAGLLVADTEGIDDPDGLRFTDPDSKTFGYDDWSYRWVRVDGTTETEVGTDSQRYQRVAADVGKLIQVEVSFRDRVGTPETVTSLPFGPVPARATAATAVTLVGNTGQTNSTTASITQQYAQGFHLGPHGQGYEISGVSIDLAAVPTTGLTVSLWIGGQAGSGGATANKVFDFENPDPFVVGLNQFTAPAGAFAYQNVRYWIVLSDFGASLSIKETTSDAEDAGGEPGAALEDQASVRAASSTEPWSTSPSRDGVLRLAVEGSRRASGFLASTYAQAGGQQEIVSIGDGLGVPINLGAADRYLVRGFSWYSDDTTPTGVGIYNPFDLRRGYTLGSPQLTGSQIGQQAITAAGDRLFGLIPTRYGAGINVWTAPQGSTVAGSDSYLVYEKYDTRPHGTTLQRVHATSVTAGDDRPTAPGVSLPRGVGDFAGKPLMAFIGDPLYALVQNLGQTNNGFVEIGFSLSNDRKVVTQGFTTGSQEGGYGLLGIGVNSEGSVVNGVAQIPEDSTSVSVSVYSADNDGKPDSKLFDLISPSEYAVGHSFFEAPDGKTLAASTTYVLVWRHVGIGAQHRLQKTTGNSEDAGALGGATIADAFHHGISVTNLTQDSGGNSLEIAVYTDTPPANATGQPEIRASAEGAPYLFAETEDIRDEDGLPFTNAFGDDMTIGAGASGHIKFLYSYRWLRVDGDTETEVGSDSANYQLVEADYGKLIRVEVSFTDQDGFAEVVTSDSFRPVQGTADSALTSSTLVSNTGQADTADATIDTQYAQGFTLGGHGQGYELSGVSIELAAVPTDLRVSLWVADHADKSSTPESKLYDFKNPATFVVGANEFTAPPGVLLHQNIRYAVVLSGYTTLSIRETTSDAEDTGGEEGARLDDKARVRDLGETGRWGFNLERDGSAKDRQTGTGMNIDTPVLRLAVKGSQRARGILASTYGQAAAQEQEIISLGDECCIQVDVGEADRYLVRGLSWNADDTTQLAGGVTNPFELRQGSNTGSELYRLYITRNIAGMPEWSAPRGATVPGGSDNKYFFSIDWDAFDHIGDGTRRGHTQTRAHATTSQVYDTPLASGLRFSETGSVSVPQFLAAVLGEPLYAMVQNLGQTDLPHLTVGPANSKVATQEFTTGSATGGYRLQGIGVNVVGSDDDDGVAQVPDDGTSVTVSLYSAHSDGKPNAKLYDLISPDVYAPGHTFFEAPAGKTLAASTDYVLVWTHNGGTQHRLQRTLSNREDSGAFGGASIADAFHWGSSATSLTPSADGHALEIAVYTDSVPGVTVYTDLQPGGNATGQPVIRASAEGAPYLFAETTDIRDSDGLPFTLGSNGAVQFSYTYRWLRVDGQTETEVGADSSRYQLVDADYGKLIRVEVSFTDQDGFSEVVASDPFRPVQGIKDSALTATTLVSNTGQTDTADATLDKQYAMGFTLGGHGQGYELSGVSIELAAAPTDLTVSLWVADHADRDSTLESRLYDFKNPATFAVGANEFTAPPGVLLHQNVQYAVVLSGYTSLMIKETTSDAEDTGGETGALLVNTARLRALGSSGRWGTASDRETGTDPNIETPVLRLAVEGSQRASGILASTYGQAASGDQEIISLGDDCCLEVNLGAADRYLVRGFSWNSDNTTPRGAGVTNPFELREDTDEGDEVVRLFITRNIAGVPEWSAPRGATVPGGDRTYVFAWDQEAYDHIEAGARRGHVLTRVHATQSTLYDTPLALGVIFSGYGDVDVPQFLAAVLGEPLYALVQNLGQADSGYTSVVGGSSVVLQAFTTGSDTGGYRLQGIGVNLEGSELDGVPQVPDDGTSVTVSLYTADANGKPDTKQFDLISPDEYAPGHTFFEAPAGKTLAASTTYVMVWTHQGGTEHRLQRTASNAEDAGAFGGATIADAFHIGSSVTSLTEISDALEIVVYTDSAPDVTVYTDISPGNSTGRPVVLVSAEGAGILAADPSRIADPEGLPHIGDPVEGIDGYDLTYRWMRVDGDTEVDVGTDSQRYQPVAADVGKLIQVEVSFTDLKGGPEFLTSVPFGPIPPRALSAEPETLVTNTGQSPAAAVDITDTYAVGFRLGTHGQGYEISSVAIDLAAAPTGLKVSLWNAGPRGFTSQGWRTARLFDFENPESFQVGLNEFTAPDGVLVYQNLNYFIVLSGFGDSLSINETTSGAEDAGGEPGAMICNFSGNEYLVNAGEANEMRISCGDAPADSGVLRLAVRGSPRSGGILASNYAQPLIDDMGTEDTSDDTIPNQEITSAGDKLAWGFVVGEADRYLLRGATFAMDDSTSAGAGFINPFWLRSDSLTGDRHFDLVNTRDENGIPVWTAPQGATVAGGCTTDAVTMEVTCNRYVLDWGDINVDKQNNVNRIGAVLTRLSAVANIADGLADEPTAPGVSLSIGGFLAASDYAGPTPYMAVHGEPLVAMVQNLGQADNSYVWVGDTNAKVLSQGFSTGSNGLGYRLQGIGINIEGSNDQNVPPRAQLPENSASVSVSVYTDSNGKPGEKLFDLISPTEFAAGHSFFEAPPGTFLTPHTSYVLVWKYQGGSWQRLQHTASNSEDPGARPGASAADAFYLGADLSSLSKDASGNALEFAVYTEVMAKVRFAPGVPVSQNWLHIPDGVAPGSQFRLVFVTQRDILPTSDDIEYYNEFVVQEAEGDMVRCERVAVPYTNPVIRRVAEEVRAVVCTASVDARTNTGMEDPVGVAVHWLDGGWENRPTLIAGTYDGFYGSEWVNSEYGARATGNFTRFSESAKVWTGCDASGAAHPTLPMGANTPMQMVAVGTPNDPDANDAPLGAVDVSTGYAYHQYYVTVKGEPQPRLLPLYAISPIFTVVDDGSPRTVWSSSMTVGRTAGTVDRVGFDSTQNRGSLLGSPQFTFGGSTVSLTALEIRRLTVSNVVTSDKLELQPSQMFPTAADANLVLELDGVRFPLADADRQPNFYAWSDHGLTWTEGRLVQIRLLELREGN